MNADYVIGKGYKSPFTDQVTSLDMQLQAPYAKSLNML